MCQSYWYPLYAYLRRRGYAQEEAEDLVQGFFAQLLEKDYIKAADRSRGRFRSFLLTSLKNYAATLSLDFQDAEGRYTVAPADGRTPEQEFDRGWAMAQIEHVLERMRNEAGDGESAERFELLHGFLTGSAEADSYKEVAQQLDMSEGAVKVAVHRLRRRFGAVLREEVARTLADDADVDDEIRHLFAAFES